ncbi:MAG: ABC transporter permease [Candidatus Hodarchaeales archaeon]|jgi:ABC-2 type transport system permease protein
MFSRLLDYLLKAINRILALIRKEVDFMSKEKVSIGILFVLPIIIIYIAGTATLSLEGPPAPVWIFDQDQTELSTELVDDFLKSKNMSVVDSVTNGTITIQQAEELLPTKDLSAYIIIPEGFEVSFEVNRSSDLLVFIDSLDYIAAVSLEGGINNILVKFQIGQGVFRAQLFYFPEFQPELSLDILFIGAPAVLTSSLFASMNLISSQCIVGDIPLRRLLIAPTRRFEVVIAKTVSYAGLAFIQAMISLFLVEFVFGLETTGVFLDVFVVVFTSALSGVTMGILFSVISSTRLQAAQMFLLVYVLDMMIMMRLRVGFLLMFIPLEQGKKAIINIAYRGLSILHPKVFEYYFNLLLTTVLCFILAILMFQIKKELV